MNDSLLRFVKYKNVTNTAEAEDGTSILFAFTMVNGDLIGSPEEAAKTTSKRMKVSISCSVRNPWGIDDDELILVLFEIGRREIIEKLRQQGQLSDDEFVVVPRMDTCPFDPKRIQHPDGFTVIVDIPTKIGFIQ